MKTRIISTLIIGLIFLSSCEKVVTPEELKLGNSSPQIAIEGYVTNQLGPYQVLIRQSVDYFSKSVFDGVNSAVVTLSDNAGQVETLIYQPGSEGIYLSNTFQGMEGREYYLTVEYNGQDYTASCIMFPTLKINELSYRFKEEAVHVNEKGYFVTVNAEDRPDRLDYYRVKGYKNDSLYDDGEDYIIENDYASDGNNIEIECSFNYDIGDTAKIEVMSIAYSTYQFYLSLKQQLTAGTGNNFTLPATNVKGNIEGGALGIFAAYSVSEKQIVIQ